MTIERDINKRWEQGLDHHPKSFELYTFLSEVDMSYGGDYFCWKCGGDGDNGETLMYMLDVHFELLDQKNLHKQTQQEDNKS